MSYSVLANVFGKWIVQKFPGTKVINTAHMSAAYAVAHAIFKDGSNVRVVSAADHSVIYCELNNETHRVDEHGQVRPILPGVPDGERRWVGTIALTPTWSAVLPILILAMTNGTDEGRKMATEELKNMAKAADAYNSSVK